MARRTPTERARQPSRDHDSLTPPTTLPAQATALERTDKTDPSTWKLGEADSSSMEDRILSALKAQGFPATSVELDPGKLKGGYICDTMRVFIGYGVNDGGKPTSPVGEKKVEFPTNTAREEATARIQGDKAVEKSLPKSVGGRPATAILKMASPLSNDHDVAMRLRLYEREWHFYEHMAARVPVRVAMLLGSVKDLATGLITEGVLLEDLEIPGAELCPKLDDNGVLTTVTHCARQHAQFWNNPELSSGALGIKPHNSPWYQPVWGNDLNGYWPRFEKKWRARGPAGDAMGPGLPDEAYAIGQAIVENFAWVQDELSSKPHTFNHGDVKPPNMFMMPGGTPAFIDWQYTAVGKGCQDILFFLIEGYTEAECRRLEPIVMAHYHSALVQHGVSGYSFDDLRRDWKLACMHFPFYVAMWFGTTPDEELVDAGFPRRFVPRAFDAIIRNEAHLLLPSFATKAPTPSAVKTEGPVPDDHASCAAALIATRVALVEARRERDELKAAMETIVGVANGVTIA